MQGRKDSYYYLWVIPLIFSACVFNKPIDAAQTPVLPSPAPTSFSTFDMGAPFDCWTETASTSSGIKPNGDVFFIISDSTIPSNYLSLYRFRQSNQTYERIASNLLDLHLGSLGTNLAPNHEAFWYLAEGSSGKGQIFIYQRSFDTSHEVPLLRDGDRDPLLPDQWSANGSCLLFTDRHAIIAYQLSDGKLQRKPISLSNFGGILTASPDGKWWAYSKIGAGIGLSDLEGTSIESPAFDAGEFGALLRWSPDGTRLAFAYGVANYTRAYGYLNVRMITFHSDGRISFEDVLHSASRIIGLEWSPDGSLLYIHRAGEEGGGTLHAYRIDQKLVQQIAVSTKASSILSFSPDGKQVFTAPEEGDEHQLQLYDLTTLEKRIVPLPETSPEKRFPFINAIFWLSK